MYATTFLTLLFLGQVFSQGFPNSPSKLRYSSSISSKHSRYFVKFASSQRRSLASNTAYFKAKLLEKGIKTNSELSFGELFEGLSLTLTNPADLSRLVTISNVQEVIPVQSHSRPSVIKKDIKDMALKYTHGVTGVARVRQKWGYKGKGVKVAVLDSGIDYTHPALGGCFGPGCKVAFGYNFAYMQEDGGQANDPQDCNGHGTHVAGIIAADGRNFTGVAPEVTLGAYKIFACNDSVVSDDVVIQALEKAKKDGMQIINLSLGVPSGWTGHPLSQAVERLTAQGVHVFSAAGNAGSEGLWEVSAPSIAPTGFSVASFDNFRYIAHVFKVDSPVEASDSSSDLFDYFNSDALSLNFTQTPLISAARYGQDDLACNDYNSSSLFDGQIVMAQRGNCSWNEKMSNIKKAGGIAAIFYNDEIGPLYALVTEADSIPVISITQENGLKLLSLLNASSNGLSISFLPEPHPFDNPYGGKISAFSSWGPGPLLEQKPDLGAPGGLIYSTYPVANGSYITFSGTSMSTPYAAAAAAIYLEARGDVSPPELLEVFRQTANPAQVFGSKDYEPVQHQGAGMLNLYKALISNSKVTPTRIQFLPEDLESNWTRTIVVKNNASWAQDYMVTHHPALSIQPWDHQMRELSQRPQLVNTSVVEIQRVPNFTLSPGQSKSITLKFSTKKMTGDFTRLVFGGYVRVTPSSRNRVNQSVATSLRVTYSGMLGSYRGISLFPTRPGLAFPCLFDLKTSLPVPSGETVTYSLAEDDLLMLFYTLLHPVKKLKVLLLDAQDGQHALVAGEGTEVGRNDYMNTPVSVFNWNGDMVAEGGGEGRNSTKVQNGEYRLLLQALPPFANENLAEDWQSWTSPMFRVNLSAAATAGNATENVATEGAEERVESFIRSMFLPRSRRTRNIESSKDSSRMLENSILPRPFSVAPSFE